MGFTLSELLQQAYAELGQLMVGTATGGTSTTVVDSLMQDSGGDDDWKNGAVFMVDAGGAAPEGEFQRILGYDDSAGEFTVDAAFSAAPESGDSYGIVSAYYPLRTMIELVNAGLRALGDIPLVDTTTIDTAVGQTEYAAALAWKRRPPVMVDYQGLTGQSDDNQWVRVYDWEYVPAAPGETGLIVFRRELPAVRDVRIWYVDSHPRVEAFDDVIAEALGTELAVSACVERALRWQNSRLGGGDRFLLERWNDAKLELERARIHNPVWKPGRRARLDLAGVGR